MTIYLILAAAIAFEVLGTLLLPASQNFTKVLPTVTLFAAYAVSFYLLAMVSQKLPLSIVYASWSGIGRMWSSATAPVRFRCFAGLAGCWVFRLLG